MSCIQFGVTIEGDVNGKLEKVVNDLAEHDYAKLTILAGYLTDENFINYVRNDEQVNEFRNIVDINANTLKRLLNSYFVSRHINVENSTSKKQSDRLLGFSSAGAVKTAIDHTGDIILDVYYEDASKPEAYRRSHVDMLQAAIRKIDGMFTKEVFIPLVKRKTAENNPAINEEIEKARAANKLYLAENKKLNALYDAYKSATDENAKAEIKEQIDEQRVITYDLQAKKNLLFGLFIDKYGNTIENNYLALHRQIKQNPNEWFDKVIKSNKLFSIAREFEDATESEKLDEFDYVDEEDVINSNSEGIDEMAKNWDNRGYSSYTKHVGARAKLILGRLYQLTSVETAQKTVKDPKTGEDKVETVYQYNTNNELGVRQTMGAQFVMHQIESFASFYSVPDFIDSVEQAAKSIPSLAGLIQLVDMMKADPVLANEMFHQLANPAIKKSMATVIENGIDFSNSNKNIDRRGYVLFDLLNNVKATYKDAFNAKDSSRIISFASIVNKRINNKSNLDAATREDIDNLIFEILHKYIPTINDKEVRAYLYSDNDRANILERYRSILSNLQALDSAAEDVFNSYNEVYANYMNKLSEYNRTKAYFDQAGETSRFNQTEPVFDYSEVSFDKFYLPLLSIANKLVNYRVVTNELNSINSEGNMSSDLIRNNYITNLLKQIKYAAPEEANAGLERLKVFVSQCRQYDYSPFFYGVKDENGNVLDEGLFNNLGNGNILINKNARKLIDAYLFDGAKSYANSKAVPYDKMSKVDYFITNMLAYEKPIAAGELLGDKGINNNYGGFFLRTPADAPNNFIVQTIKYQDARRMFTPAVGSEAKYITRVKSELAKQHKIVNGNDSSYDEQLFVLIDGYHSANLRSPEEIYDVLRNGSDNIVYNKLRHWYDADTHKVLIPLLHKSDQGHIVVWLEGDKVLGTANNVAENLVVKEVNTLGYDNDQVFTNIFLEKVSNIIRNEGITNGGITQTIEPKNSAYHALRQHVLGEIVTFVNQLNQVFELDKKTGKWVSKTDTTGLFERVHFNDGAIVSNGRLTGKFFEFSRLFETNGYNASKALEVALSLYGRSKESIFHKDGDRLVINNFPSFIEVSPYGKIVFRESKKVHNAVNKVLTEWVNNFNQEVINKSKQYAKVMQEQGYRTWDVFEVMINGVIANMNFDDMFLGDSKFYKNAQDNLKRAKEVQAGGKAYGNFDINDHVGGSIHNVVDANNREIPIRIRGRLIQTPRRGTTGIEIAPMMARNGFRGVTISNTVRPSKNAGRIYNEVFNILKQEMSEEQAARIAAGIADGYSADTTTNDAQSYITLEEFIARRHADGTLHEYEGILKQLMDPNVDIKDIDLKLIKQRIQVQKNFYYDIQYDAKTGVAYPRQIKNAEFVLIPKLIKGTDLETLYNIMRRNDIGQVNTAETTKAAKKNVLTFWDNDGNVHAEEFEAAITGDVEGVYNDSVVENYYYRYLYKQQEVPEHMKDEVNKAGIQIMKKMIDNASPAVEGYVREMLDNYCANIKDSFNTLVNNMGWKVDENGSIVSKDGGPIRFDEFYKKARREAARLGMDSNFIEYLTPDVFGNPAMPSYMNNVSSKLESIAQAIFNSSITRQTLPGWHAAQVTQIGHGAKVLDSNGKLRELRYHPEVVDENGNVKQEAYCEVLIPRWSNLIPKDYDIAKLEAEGLDIQICYRMPTEGKQSVSVIKVVGFLDDAYGSTIMLPDEWVTQTGSDFDVDSVYGACFEMYRDRDGVIRKVEFDNDTSEAGVRRRYIRYVKDKLKDRIDKDIITDEFIKNKINEGWDNLNSLLKRQRDTESFNKLMSIESDIYNQLSEADKLDIKHINRVYEGNAYILQRYTALSNHFRGLAGVESNADIKALYEQYADITRAIADVINIDRQTREEAVAEFKSTISQEIKDLFEASAEKYFETVQQVAEDAGLPTIDEFSEWSLIDQQSRAARNNKVVGSMIAIMNDPASREENYSRSNFDKLNAAMEKNDKLRGANKIPRSSYNPFDQIDFMENAISGLAIKAFSVQRDNLNSVNNRAKTRLHPDRAITVEYDASEYDVRNAIAAYGENVVAFDKDGNVITNKEDLNKAVTFTIKHDRLGHSNNNRNIVGDLVTVYSSQTTAHILDAIKTGTIYNENLYTFGTFKTLVDVGIDYDTAIAFLMQPAVSSIVESHNESNSVYLNTSSNPINNAYKRLAQRLGITEDGKVVNEFTTLTSVMKLLSSNENLKKAYFGLFGADLSNDLSSPNKVVRLNKKMLQNRLQGANLATIENVDKRYIDAAFDLAMIKFFERVHDTSTKMEAIARCTNPDKFGAKQTLRSTRKTLDDIKKYSDGRNATANVMQVNGEPLLRAVYPGITSSTGVDINQSVYPYLAAFIKYATQTSVDVNKQLFITESDAYHELIKAVEKQLGRQLTDAEYKEYKQYLVSNAYAAVPYLTIPLTVNKYGQVTYDIDRIVEYEATNTRHYDTERIRIFGRNVTDANDITVANINEPTDEEIAAFNKLTPAQKVIFIQKHFPDGRGVFGYLNVNLYNQYEYKHKGFSSQTIKFDDQTTDIEVLIEAFNNSFYNKNPLVRLAAIDLIKYAFVVEGFKFKRGGVSKIISNSAIYNNIEDKGLNLVDAINRQMMVYNNHVSAGSKQFIERFIRSHSEYVKELKIPVVGEMADSFNRYFAYDGIVYIPYEHTANKVLEYLRLDANDIRDYVKISRPYKSSDGKYARTNVLYKIIKGQNGVYLHPLNPLERNEVSDVSADNRNNKYRESAYYEFIIEKAEAVNVTINELVQDENVLKEIVAAKGLFTIKPIVTKRIIDSLVNSNILQETANNPNTVDGAAANKLVNDITSWLGKPVEEQGRHGMARSESRFLNEQFPKNVPVVQNIAVGEDVVRVKITRTDVAKHTRWFIANSKLAKRELIPQEEFQLALECRKLGLIKPKVFKIERVTEEEVRQEQEELDAKVEEAREMGMMAISNPIEDVEASSSIDFTEQDKVAKDIYNEFDRLNKTREDTAASEIKRQLEIAGFDSYSARSIHENSGNIYRAAANYYDRKSKELLDKINHFQTISEGEFSIDNEALYKHLREHPEDYPALVQLILEAKTLGDQFYGIFNLNIDGYDAETSKAINKIRNAINEVKNNTKLKKAVDLLFNDYIANEFSTNPLVRNSLVNLKDTFGDTDWFDLNFSDVGELNHKQVQTVVKYVYAILNEATQIVAPQAVAAFNKQYEAIMAKSGPFDWNHFITKEGKFIEEYNDNYLKDRETVIKNLADAKAQYGEQSIEYERAKLVRDKWMADNVHQYVHASYYHKKNDIVETILNVAPNEYLRYKAINAELYGDKRSYITLTDEEKKERRALMGQLTSLLSDVRPDGTLKSFEEQERVAALKRYIVQKKALDKEYFDYEETAGFREELDYHIKVIKNYEKKHPNDNLEQRLADETYRDSYNWIHTNTRYVLNESAREAINKAFDTLKSKDHNTSEAIRTILSRANAYDAYGNIDPRKLSAKDIAEIKELTTKKYGWTYDSNAGEANLIKDIPSGLPVYTDEFYRLFRRDGEGAQNPIRLKLIGEINKLVSKVVDGNTGAIHTKDMFEKLTEEELNQLASYYAQLRNIKGKKRTKAEVARIVNNVNFVPHKEAYNREFLYAETHLKGTKQYDLWLDIFTEIQEDENGNMEVIPNRFLYDYIEAKDDKYIDKAKTNARNIIEKDVLFEPTEYYYMASEQATKEGRFKEWYEANHVFNPHTHKMEPLKVWTTMIANPNGNLKGTYTYEATYENKERTVKDEYRTDSHLINKYNAEIGHYTNNALSPKEREMMNLMKNTMNAYATTHATKHFVSQGFLPRRAKFQPDARWYGSQALGSLGLEFRNTGEAVWSENMDYVHDMDPQFDMMQLIKRKGYQDPIPIDGIGTRETQEEYEKRVAEIKEKNKKIAEENLRLDNEVLDRDWKNVFNDFIRKGTEFNAKQKVKNTVYLLLEDLKDTDAYKRSRFGNNLKRDNRRSTREITEYETTAQNNTRALVSNWARRILFDQFKKNSPYSKYADLMQNITSAKYMIFNVTGGVSNIATGMTNIFGEIFAREYFDGATYAKANRQYIANSLAMLADMYKPTTKNKTVAIIKLFDVVDFDSFTERRPNETATEYVRKVRDSLYSMQTGGEHYMQNTVLLAMLKSHRIFKDTDGKTRVGNLSNYIWNKEMETMMSLLRNKGDMLLRYKGFIASIKQDKNEIQKYDSFSKDFNEEFLREVGDKKLIKEYIKARTTAIKQAEEEFKQFATVEDQFILEDGIAVIKPDSEMTGLMFGELKDRVQRVNKKIHGVYDKIGAAKIEAEWWGGLVMQYHKHIYPGIMKRFRIKGYYNEARGTIERGSYVTLANFLSTEFRDIGKRIKNRKENGENIALASIQEVMKAAIDTVLNIGLNYRMMPLWEQNNMRRCLGDLLGVTSALLAAVAIYGLTDDDELEESEFLATLIYFADRLNSESQMYTPWGLYSEASTLWSSPIAAQNGPKDLIKGLIILTNALYDEEFSMEYSTGLYKGQNKLAVLAYRNTPIYRVYQRLSTMTKNNSYYRINESSLDIKFAKSIADAINPD